MGNTGLTPQQLEALLTFAAKKLGVTREQLAKTVQTGSTAGLGLSAETEQKLSALLGDKDTVEKLVQSPEAQNVLQKILRGE